MSDLVFKGRRALGFGRSWPCTIGRGGLTENKVEGDGATPKSILTITGCLYRADKVARPAPWAIPIGARDLWCDDPTHVDYNHYVRAPFSASHERLRRGDPLYDIVLLTDWNWPDAIAGKGSAIFIHSWRRLGYPTEGCIAFRRDHLARLTQLLAPGSTIDIKS